MVTAFSDAQDSSEVVTFKQMEMSDDDQASVRTSNEQVHGMTSGIAIQSGSPPSSSTKAGGSTLEKPNLTKTGLAANDEADQVEGFLANAEVEKDDDGDDDDDDVYVVEQIVKHRKNKRGKSYEYLVRWEGYDADDDTWEPHENIAETASALVQAYWADKGGYEANRLDLPTSTSNKRKRTSASADLLVSNTLPPMRRRQIDSLSDTPRKAKECEPLQTDLKQKPDSWAPPLQLNSWEGQAIVDTLEKNEHNELFVCLEWPKDKQKSRHKADVVYQKMPLAMLRFYEANLVFKPAK